MKDNFSTMKTLISYFLENNAKNLVDTPAIISDENVVTHRELSERVESSICYLKVREICPGMNVALRFKDPINHLVYYLALLKMGICQLSLNPNNPVNLQKKNLSLCKIELIIQDLPLTNSLIATTLCITDKSEFTVLDFNGDNACMGGEIIVGSGTTGEPKIYILSSSLLAERYQRELSVMSGKNGERHYSLSELYYFDPRQLAIEALTQGMTLLLPKTKPRSIIDFCLDQRVDHLELTGSQAVLLLSQERVLERSTSLRLPHLKSLMLTSSLITEPVRIAIMRTITKQLFINYGTNEFGLITLASPDNIVNHSGTVGKALHGVEISIVKDDGSTCNAGEVGHICIRYKLLMSGYLNNEEATKRTFTEQGYFPGDVGKLTEEGQLIFEGRKDDMMIFSGINIYPRELESVLESHPSVIESAVFPLNTATFENIPFAVVSVSNDVEEKDLLQWCEVSLGWRRPQRIFFVEKLPRNQTGKVLKRLLSKNVLEILKKQKS